MISKNEKNQGFFGISWILAHLALLGFAFSFFQFSCFFIFYHFFFFLLISDHFLRFLHDFLCFAAFWTKKCEMKTWQKLMSYKQSQKNEDKMIQKCKKEKDSNMKSFCCIFSTSAHLAFLGSGFSFFFHVFFIFYHF